MSKNTKNLLNLFLIFVWFIFPKIVFAQDITVNVNTIWEAGEYTYDNVSVVNGATLTFNGKVTLNADSLTIDAGSAISADGKGYAANQGPGAGGWPGGGGSYGGRGAGNTNSPYGSSKEPVDLGSGGGNNYGGIYAGYGSAGGGAVILKISGSLVVNGKISANGIDVAGPGGAGSGGSIYVITNHFEGTGTIIAKGGLNNTGERNPVRNIKSGGGGRIAIYFSQSSFAGSNIIVEGAQNGTIALFDKANNNLTISQGYYFKNTEGPFIFNKVSVVNNARVTADANVNVIANNLEIKDVSVFVLGTSVLLDIGEKLILSGSSQITYSETAEGAKINARILNIDEGSSITADGKGYSANQGPGAGQFPGGGGSYGGKGGGSSGSIYGSDKEPIDLGSGGGNNYGGHIQGSGASGGGAIKLQIFDTLTLNGIISANGASAQGPGGGGSGGSVLINAVILKGTGIMRANGGNSAEAGLDIPGGGGGGGRIAVYNKLSTFSGVKEVKGGSPNGQAGSIFESMENDASVTYFKLIEKTATTNAASLLLSAQKAILTDVAISGDMQGVFYSSDFEFLKITSGMFTGSGFSEGEFSINLEGVAYNGLWQGMIYPVASENRIYLKGQISGDLSGVVEGYLTESIPNSGIYDRYDAAWNLNRLATEAVSATINIGARLSYGNPYAFNSEASFYQGSFEGSASGNYSGPLGAVLTQVILTSDGEYKGQGFSVVSYNSVLGQGEAWAYDQLLPLDSVLLQGMVEDPLEGKLTASIAKEDSQNVFEGRIERLDLGQEPAADLKVEVFSPRNISPGQKVNLIVEYRNDGTKAATNAAIYNYLDTTLMYYSASPGAYYDSFSHQVAWDLGALPAKSQGVLTIGVGTPWGLPAHTGIENRSYMEDLPPPPDEVVKELFPNLISNGILYDSDNKTYAKLYQDFATTNTARWEVLYDQTNYITGPLEVYLATKDIATGRNGVGETSHITGNYPEVISYSGSTATYVNQAKHDRLSGGALYLISPQLVTQADLQAIKSKFGKIVVFQGDDLIPNNVDFWITVASGGSDRRFTRNELIAMGKEGITEALVIALERQNGEKSLTYLEVFPGMEGNVVKITWDEGNSLTQFPITTQLHSEDNIEVVTLEGIEHGEWPLLLTKFEKKHKRWPTAQDLDELKRMLENDVRKKGVFKTIMEVITANDPNEMLVSPEGDIRPGDTLNYTVNCENVGEGIAFGVYITNRLDEDLDDESLVLNDGGTYDPATRTITWFIGELQSKQKGSKTYSIKVRQDAPDKSEIINYAIVYFPSVPEETRTNGTVNRVVTYIDNVAPVTTCSVLPLPNEAGWNNSDVSASLSAVDNEGGSGVKEVHYQLTGSGEQIVSGNSAQISFFLEGAANLAFWSLDNLGNTESQKSSEIKIDKTPPALTTQVLPQANESGWNNTDVTVNFTGSDGISGIASVSQPVAVTIEGANQYVGGEAVDLAGNKSSSSVVLNIDKISPDAVITVPENEVEYILNSSATVLWLVADGLSGINSSTGTIASGGVLDTATAGTKTFSVVATDKAGNKTEISRTYYVRYSYGGVLAPINQDGSSIFKLGRVIPIKFQLKDAQGKYISTAIAKLYLSKISNEVAGTEVEAESPGEANAGNVFRYDIIDNQYIFNLGTGSLTQGTWQIRIVLDDGSSKYVKIALK